MAKTLHGLEPTVLSSRAYSLRSVWTLRMVLGSLILLGAVITTVGTSWDIQWHSFVGRDRTLIPPHEMMLGGVLISGLVALIAVCVETAWTRRNPQLEQYGTNFAGLFHSSLGAYIAGFAALDAAIAFPLDSYWHALYGIDVAIWAPFHIMILGGAALVPLGAAYMLISAARLAGSRGEQKVTRACYVGMIIAFGTMMAVFTYLLSDAVVEGLGMITLGGGIIINVFPLLSALMVAGLLISAVQAMPGRWTATLVVLVYLGYGLLFAASVPLATNYLVVQEQLSYRKDVAEFAYLSVVAMQAWFLLPLIVAPLLDLCYRRAQRKGWSLTRQFVTLTLIVLLACLPVSALNPDLFLQVGSGLGITGSLLSLLLGIVGAGVGIWLGNRLGQSMQQLEGVR